MPHSFNWDRWLTQYWDVNPAAFEKWLIARFQQKFGRISRAKLTPQDLMHVDLWKNGARNRSRILADRNPLVLQLPSRRPVDNTIVEALIRSTIRKGIAVRTASAVLTLLRPTVFSVIDRFSIAAIAKFSRVRQDPEVDTTVVNYVQYMGAFWELARSVQKCWPNFTIRNLDRALWAYGSANYAQLRLLLQPPPLPLR